MLWRKRNKSDGGDRKELRKLRKKQKSSKKNEGSSANKEASKPEGGLREWKPPASMVSDEQEHDNEKERDKSGESTEDIWDSFQLPVSSDKGSYRNYVIEVPEKETEKEREEDVLVETGRMDNEKISSVHNDFSFSDANVSVPGTENGNVSDFDFDFDAAEPLEPPLPNRETVLSAVMNQKIDFDVATKVEASERLKASLRKIRGG